MRLVYVPSIIRLCQGMRIYILFLFVLRRMGKNGKSDHYKTTALHDEVLCSRARVDVARFRRKTI